jgi:hypothetical protein
MKTFQDLRLKANSKPYGATLKAIMNFDNGYGVSVLWGGSSQSDGIDSYELAVLYKGEVTYNTHITDDVLGYITAEEVTQAMIEVQKLS